ncbi:hypothetical protein ACIPYR_23335 [Streptomyces parvus]|uniref:hypothetical protein n=1 Tax=Streptomyces parvus TaxID=66428 RepID=UPI00381334A0
MSEVPPDVAAFITIASQLPGRTLDAIRWATASAVAAGFYDSSMVPALSAPQFSALNKQVRDAFAPRAEEIRALASPTPAILTSRQGPEAAQYMGRSSSKAARPGATWPRKIITGQNLG